MKKEYIFLTLTTNKELAAVKRRLLQNASEVPIKNRKSINTDGELQGAAASARQLNEMRQDDRGSYGLSITYYPDSGSFNAHPRTQEEHNEFIKD